ncbi:hypothetical protein [Streptomyces sp. WAC 05379]|nr:hypothetical protein [Streptomyces sp. WAC 05379]
MHAPTRRPSGSARLLAVYPTGKLCYEPLLFWADEDSPRLADL